MEETDIWRTTNLLLQHHAENAAMEAAHRADAMIEKGDHAGETVWRRVYNAILELQRIKTPGAAH